MSDPNPTLRDLLAPIVRGLVAEERHGPLMVSQRNCESALGLPSRIHLENCRRSDFTPRVLKIGKLRLVDASEYRAWLSAVDRRTSVDLVEDVDDGASRVLAELGLRELSKPGKDTSVTVRTKDRSPRSLR